MSALNENLASPKTIAPPIAWPWFALQLLLWLLGIALVVCLIVAPPLGVIFFWNILIPAAPALLVVATGLWRNICPLATTSLIPDRMGWSMGLKVPPNARNWLMFIGVLALLILTPMRHSSFNTSGQATAIMLLGAAVVAVGLGFVFERRSAWCSGLCPVHPVEKLYGVAPAVSVPNLQCGDCRRCALPCQDWTPNADIRTGPRANFASRATEALMAGAFPGWIAGWFLVHDSWDLIDWTSWVRLYVWPSLGGLMTLAIWALVVYLAGPARRELFTRAFAAAAVSVYYIFRLPQLFGYNPLFDNGCLVNLTATVPQWVITLLTVFTTAFFLYWMVVRGHVNRSWSIRPPMAQLKP